MPFGGKYSNWIGGLPFLNHGFGSSVIISEAKMFLSCYR
jgi:hypothetical protein